MQQQPNRVAPGLRPIGDLVPMNGATPSPAASTPTGSPRNSATTGAPCPAPVAASSTGRPPSAIAVCNAPDEKASRAAVMALLRQPSGSCSAVGWVWRDSMSGGEFDSELVGVSGLPRERPALLALRQAIAPLCQPASASPHDERLIVSELARTLAVTVGRERRGVDDDVALDTMTDELARFPVDCVVRALGSWRRNDKWRPSLAELLGDIRWRAAPRMAALRSIEAALERAP